MNKSIFDRIERRLIKINKVFIKKGKPRLQNINPVDFLSFSGKDPLSGLRDSGNSIFNDFDDSTSVFVKISLNSSNPYPATTSEKLIKTVLQCLRDRGVQEINIGDSSGLAHLPTRKVIKRRGYDLKEYGYQVLSLDYGRWVDVNVDGEFFKDIIISDSIYRYDRIINLSNIKSHWQAGFTLATKSLVGFMHPGHRRLLHSDHIQERVAEISLAVVPDINILDGRKVFIEGGPDNGKVAGAGIIFVSGDLMEADLKAYEILYTTKKDNGIGDLDRDPFSNAFFRHFRKLRDRHS